LFADTTTANNQTKVAVKDGRSDESFVDRFGRSGAHRWIARGVSLVTRQPCARHAVLKQRSRHRTSGAGCGGATLDVAAQQTISKSGELSQSCSIWTAAVPLSTASTMFGSLV
jgi:hypothetical protein